MKRQQPLSPSDSTTLKRFCSNSPKKLRSSGVKEFLGYKKLQCFEFRDLNKKNCLMCYSFISNNFLGELKRMDDFVVHLEVYLRDRSEDVFFNSNTQSLFQIKTRTGKERLNTLLALLKLTECPEAKFEFENPHFESETLSRELIKNFAHFCRGLKDIQSLQKIYANFNDGCWGKKSATSLFIDLFPPNKIFSFRSKNATSFFGKNQDAPLESVSICITDYDRPCTAQVFRTKTKKLMLGINEEYDCRYLKLHNLINIGPFSPNPVLQQFGVRVDLLLTKFEEDTEFREFRDRFIREKEWDEEFLPQCCKSFEYLKNVNDKLELVFETCEEINIDDFSEAIPRYETQLKRAKSIIDMANEFNFKVDIFIIDLTFCLYRVAEKASLEFSDATKMNVALGYGKSGVNLIEYNGRKIKLNISFYDEDDYKLFVEYRAIEF